MNSINYYIQLSDELSTTVDGMNKRELIALANEALISLDIVMNFVDCSRSQVRQARDFSSRFDFDGAEVEGNLLKLAHGLLAKAI